MNTVLADCRACEQPNVPHRTRSDNGKLCSRCTTCAAAYSRAWRERQWQRRKLRDTWKGIIARCHDPEQGRNYGPAASVPRYADYGAKGIKVCRRWRHPTEGFKRFVADVGPPPTLEHTLDRKCSARGYSPSNVRWATPGEQASNRKNTRWVTAHHPDTGEKLTLSLSDWMRTTGVERTTLAKRLNRGWEPDRAVVPPLVLADVPF